MTQTLFITSSGTGIGKTFVTCAMCRQLQNDGKKVAALKPVISGWDGSDDMDTVQILNALGQSVTTQTIGQVSPWRFAAPLSPDMAASKEGRQVPFDEVLAFCQQPREVDHLLIEGVGGVMVPLTDNETTLDLMKALNVPAVLVVGSYLGSISHTLTAVNALQNASIHLHSIIISESENSGVGLNDTLHSLRNFITGTPISALPRTCD